MKFWLFGIAAFVLIPDTSLFAAEPAVSFSLSTYRGTPWSLDDVENADAVVVAFLGTECPLAKLYGPRLTELQNQFTDQGVAFVGINSNSQDSVTEIAAYVARPH